MFFLPYRKIGGEYVHTTSGDIMPTTATMLRSSYRKEECVYSGTQRSDAKDDILGGKLMARECERADMVCQKRMFYAIL